MLQILNHVTDRPDHVQDQESIVVSIYVHILPIFFMKFHDLKKHLKFLTETG